MTKRPEEVQLALKESIRHLRMTRAQMPEMYGRVYKSLSDLIYAVRVDMEEAQEALGERASRVTPEGPASWDDHYSMLSCAARALQQFGATDSQVRYLATLAVKDGLTLSQMNVSTLSKTEASGMISTFKKD